MTSSRKKVEQQLNVKELKSRIKGNRRRRAMIRIVAKPVDQYINEDHIEDCEYFTRGQVPFNDCEVKEQIKDEENQVWETVAIT